MTPTPKEKARKLVDSFLTASFGTMQEYVPVPYEFAKQCALIVVDEILNLDYFSIEGREYWQQVKTEIEQL